jgi:hypothetical protein
VVEARGAVVVAVVATGAGGRVVVVAGASAVVGRAGTAPASEGSELEQAAVASSIATALTAVTVRAPFTRRPPSD